MSSPPTPSQQPDQPETPPSWAGAPGFSPYQDSVMPHAPMPGAPPYPPDIAPPPPEIGRRTPDPGLGRALQAAGAWAALSILLVFLVGGMPGAAELGLFVLTLVLPTALTTLAVRLVAAGRGWPFWALLLVAAPFFWALRFLQTLVLV